MTSEYERGHAAGREAGIREAAEIAIKAAIAAAEKAPTNGLSAEGFKSDCIAIEQRQHWKGIRRGGLAAKTAILALLDAPAPAGVTVPQGCICPPTSEQTCGNPLCPRKLLRALSEGRT
jgi:hypothetical protein